MFKRQFDDFANNIDQWVSTEVSQAEDEVISSEELYKILSDRQTKSIFIKTKFPSLNTLINGFCGGELIVTSGLTGNGKTLLYQTFTHDFAEQGTQALWFTYEVPALQFLKQFGEPIPHFFMPRILRDKSMEWIFLKICEAKDRFGVSAIFIDHLHFLADIMMSRNPSLEIGQVMRTLKRWALELEIIIFIIAHTRKILPDKELGSGDTRDSSFIEQEADKVFYIWRRLDIENEAVLKVTKDRSTGVMDKKIRLIKSGRYLAELAQSKDHDEVD